MADIEVIREPLTYERGSKNSWFRDLGLAEINEHAAAQKRLQRHADEMAVEVPKREARMRREFERRSYGEGFEYRTNPGSVDARGGYFSPPIWLIEDFATTPRTGRVLSALAPNLALPKGVSQVNVPRLTTGLHAGTQTDGQAVPSRDPVDAAVSSTVVTIAGVGDVSMQALEQSPQGASLDFAFFKELTESYVAQLETQLINGSYTNQNQLDGLLNISSINPITYTDATPTAPEFLSPLGQAVAAIGNNRKRPPECWLMTTSRHAWLLGGEDTATQPLGAFVNTDGPGKSDLLTYPVELTDVIPVTLTSTGTPGGTQDRIIACRPSDMLVFESEPQAVVDREVLSGTLQARFSLHAYAAALLGRYPTGISVVAGTGCVVQTSF